MKGIILEIMVGRILMFVWSLGAVDLARDQSPGKIPNSWRPSFLGSSAWDCLLLCSACCVLKLRLTLAFIA